MKVNDDLDKAIKSLEKLRKTKEVDELIREGKALLKEDVTIK